MTLTVTVTVNRFNFSSYFEVLHTIIFTETPQITMMLNRYRIDVILILYQHHFDRIDIDLTSLR